MRIDRGLSPAEEAALDEWTAGDTRCGGALARAMAVDSYLDRAAALGDGFQPVRQNRIGLSRRGLMLGGGSALAASLVGVIGIGLLSAPKRIETAKGDVRRVALPEGSAITLNTATLVEPAFDREARRVTLVQGEALFDVARDPARPFTVVAAGTAVRAVGTSFTVRLHDDGKVGVIVYEGIVEVSRDGLPPLRLLAGSATVASPGQRLVPEPVPVAVRDRAIAWRNGRLDLAGLTLSGAAAEFARYADYRIVIADPEIAALEVTGVYSTSDPKGFAEAAALSLGLAVRERPGEIEIVPAS